MPKPLLSPGDMIRFKDSDWIFPGYKRNPPPPGALRFNADAIALVIKADYVDESNSHWITLLINGEVGSVYEHDIATNFFKV